MSFGLETRLQQLKRHYRDGLLALLTLVLVILIFVLAALLANGIVVQALGVVLALALFGGALVVSGSTVAFFLLPIAFLPNVSVVVLRPSLGPSTFNLYLVASAWLIISMTLGWVGNAASQLFYFNFVTLTSVGYGDLVPIDPIARSLSNLETMLGQFYPATLLARLVTLEIAGRTHYA